MAIIESEIHNMYAEIVEWGGSFGDPINHGSYNPYEKVRVAELSSFVRTGVSITILHYLATAIDNSTYADAVVHERRRLKPIIKEGLLDHQPLVRKAAESFLESEVDFHEALDQVYLRLICC